MLKYLRERVIIPTDYFEMHQKSHGLIEREEQTHSMR